MMVYEIIIKWNPLKITKTILIVDVLINIISVDTGRKFYKIASLNIKGPEYLQTLGELKISLTDSWHTRETSLNVSCSERKIFRIWVFDCFFFSNHGEYTTPETEITSSTPTARADFLQSLRCGKKKWKQTENHG